MFTRRRHSDFSDELRAHLDLEAERLRSEGLPKDEAAFAARRALGNVTAIEERFYDAHHWRWLDQLFQDIRGCFRLWRKRPLTAATALLTLTLGTGLNIALFRVIWSTLLQPLPYPNATQLVQVWAVRTAGGGFSAPERQNPSSTDLELWRTRSRTFQALAMYRPWRITVGSGGDPERARAGLVSAEFFPLLGAQTRLGRTFSAAEIHAGADDVAVLSYAYWKTRFGGDRRILGANIVLDGKPCTVIGVLASSFRDLLTNGAVPPEVYVPISKAAKGPLKISSGPVIGRMRSGAGIDPARAELTALTKTLEPDGVNLTNLQQEIGFSVRPVLLVMFAATACLLLIACTNVANLLLAQAIGRRQELAIRAALGAGRLRLIRQLLTEALALAATGALFGLAAGWVLSRGMITLYPGTLPRVAEGNAGPAVLAFALAVAILSVAFFGVLPAVLATRRPGDAALRVGRASSLGRGASRWREALIAVQVSAAVALLIAAGLLLKTFATLRATDLGFAHNRLFTAQVVLPESRYRTPESYTRFAQAWVERLRSIPGVEEAGVTNSLPLAFNILLTVQFDVAGHTEHRAGARTVAGDYFAALGLQTKAGRPLTAADNTRRDVVVVNESFVRTYLQHTPVLGTVLRFGPERSATIVGIVHDLRNMGLNQPSNPEMYFPFRAFPGVFLDTVIRTAIPPERITTAARAELRQLDPGLALAQISTMDQILDDQVAQPRFQATLLALFAAVAIALAAIGIYGVIAQGVRARTAEFGVRLALGATARNVFWMVVRQGLRAPLAGLALGLAAACAGGRVLSSFLYGVTPRDPFVLTTAAALIAVVSLAGCALPAGQACRTDPARALRDE